MSAWHLGVLANGAIGIAYVAISWMVLRGVHRSRGWRTDRLALATAGIFASCAAGHLAHLDHLLVGAAVIPARAAYDVHLAAVDGITAVVAVLYWSLRRSPASEVSVGEVYADTGRRLAEAAQLHDRVLQQLVAAKLALDLDRREDALVAVRRALASTSDLVLHLDPDGRIGTRDEQPLVPEHRVHSTSVDSMLYE